MVPFSAGYAADAVTRTLTEAGTGYGGSPSTTTITCGPFTAEYPPEERIGGR